MQVQLGYVLQQLGKEKEAQAIYNAVLRAKPADIGLVAVASNNLVTINRLHPIGNMEPVNFLRFRRLSVSPALYSTGI